MTTPVTSLPQTRRPFVRRLGITAAVVALLGGLAVTGAGPLDAQTNTSETYRQINLFGTVFERVRESYVEEVSEEKLFEAAINGMLASLDPHSSYLNAKNYRDMQVQTRGEFGGLGIEVTMENGLIKVVSPIDDTPASKAGLQPGDLVSHLDSEPVLGLTLSEAVEKMRGKVGSKITLTIRRGTQDAFDVVLERAVITIRSVRFRTIGDIGYVRITTFNEQSTSGLQAAVADIKGKLGKKLHGYVIDLRNNPGGLLDQAISVSDAFLERGEIVSTRGRIEENSSRANAEPGDITDGAPLVVLINGGSASASEIVAGALQDQKRGVLMGTTSFGKGSVQTVLPLNNERALKITTALYYTPNGRSIQAQGIVPDIEVRKAKITNEVDSEYYKEADLQGHLGNGNGGADQPTGSSAKAKPMPQDDDYQLAQALSLLKGLSITRSR